MAKILFIDDDVLFGDLTRQRLEKGGHDITYRNSAFGALLPLQKGEFDLLLLDVNMPGLSGKSFLKIVKDKAISMLKIVLYSAMDFDALRRLAIEQNADGYLTKSATKEQLLQKIEFVLSKR